MTQSMETLAAAAHEVEGVSPDIASVADEQRHTDVTLRPLTGKDIIEPSWPPSGWCRRLTARNYS